MKRGIGRLTASWEGDVSVSFFPEFKGCDPNYRADVLLNCRAIIQKEYDAVLAEVYDDKVREIAG